MAYRDDQEAARHRIRHLERELAERDARLVDAEARLRSGGRLSKRQQRQRRRDLEAQQRGQHAGADGAARLGARDSWLGRAASPLGFLRGFTPVLLGGGFALAFALGLGTLLGEAGLTAPPPASLLFVTLLGYPALVAVLYTLALGATWLAARRERSWARQLPFTLERYPSLYDAFMTAERDLRCRVSTASLAVPATIVAEATTLAHGVDADASVHWHDGHLELALPLPRTATAWRAARQVHARVHQLVDLVLVPLHASHALTQVTLHTRR